MHLSIHMHSSTLEKVFLIFFLNLLKKSPFIICTKQSNIHISVCIRLVGEQRGWDAAQSLQLLGWGCRGAAVPPGVGAGRQSPGSGSVSGTRPIPVTSLFDMQNEMGELRIMH